MLESIKELMMATHGLTAESIVPMDTYGPMYEKVRGPPGPAGRERGGGGGSCRAAARRR